LNGSVGVMILSIIGEAPVPFSCDRCNHSSRRRRIVVTSPDDRQGFAGGTRAMIPFRACDSGTIIRERSRFHNPASVYIALSEISSIHPVSLTRQRRLPGPRADPPGREKPCLSPSVSSRPCSRFACSLVTSIKGRLPSVRFFLVSFSRVRQPI